MLRPPGGVGDERLEWLVDEGRRMLRKRKRRRTWVVGWQSLLR